MKGTFRSILFTSLALALTIGSVAGITAGPGKADADTYTNWHPGHYLTANYHDETKTVSGGDYDDILENTLSNDGTRIFRGIQQVYFWKDLEPTKDNYDFSQIEADLSHMPSLAGNLKLVIQIAIGGTSETPREVPNYITGSTYGGGVYELTGVSGATQYNPVIWNDNVRTRFKLLLSNLKQDIGDHANNTKLELINLSETAIGATPEEINAQAGISPDFTYELYTDAINDISVALTSSFPNHVKIQYINGPKQNLSLEAMVDGLHAAGAHVGLGAPDIKIDAGGGTEASPGQFSYYNNAWNLASAEDHKIYGIAPLGAAVQSPDYWSDAAHTTLYPTKDIFNFAHDKLALNYIFWANLSPGIDQAITYLKGKVTSTDKAGGLQTLED
jgi:hypothetical protein